MTAATVALPPIFSEDRRGRVRVGFRVPGSRRKVQRTFDYAHEGEEWAEEARRRVLGAVLSGDDVETVIADVLGRVPVPPAAPSFTPPPPSIAPSIPVVEASSATPRLERYARTWLDARRGSIDLSTHRWYTTHVDAILDSPGDSTYARLSTRPIGEITRREIEAWRTRELDRGAGRPTMNARLKVLGMILRYALSDRLIPSDPTSEIRALKHNPTRKPTLSRDDETRLFADPKFAGGIDGDRQRLFVLLGLYLGLRYEEAAGVMADDLIRTDDGRHYLAIVRIRRRNGDTRPSTKDGGSRLVPIGGDVLTLFRRVAVATAPRALLFPWKYDAYRHGVWKGVTDRAGLNRQKSTAKGTKAERFGFHSLRHTCGSRLAAAGRPRSEIAAFLGHADESTTAGYIHATVDGERHDLALAALGLTG